MSNLQDELKNFDKDARGQRAEARGKRKEAVGLLTPALFRKHIKSEKDLVLDYGRQGATVTYTVDDLKTALEESERSLHDAVFIARQVWEKDCDAVKFDIDDLVQIESALQEICNITAGIDSGDDGE